MTNKSISIFQSLGNFQNLFSPQMIINPSQRSIKKISQQHTFPCYHCGNDIHLVKNCHSCLGKGFLKGNHPMVKIIQQIIDSKFKNRVGLDQQFPNEEQKNIRVSSIENTLDVDLTSSISGMEVHEGYNCDNCDMYPIRGKRYSCAVCKEYDLCEECERESGHEHPLERKTMKESQQELEREEYLVEEAKYLSEIKAMNKDTQKSFLFRNTRESMTTSRLSRISQVGGEREEGMEEQEF